MLGKILISTREHAAKFFVHNIAYMYALLRIIEQAIGDDDETTATQLQAKLVDYEVYMFLTRILRNRRLLKCV